MPLNTTTEANRCPRCKQPNDCVLARDGSASSEACWCRRESFPLGLIEAPSGQYYANRCICRSCLQAWRLEHPERPGHLDHDERETSRRGQRVSHPDARPNEADEVHDADRRLD
jgi:hypothetical protein